MEFTQVLVPESFDVQNAVTEKIPVCIFILIVLFFIGIVP